MKGWCLYHLTMGPWIVWAQLGSNQRPWVYETPALTTELWARLGLVFTRRLAPRVGLEPTTLRLTAGRSAIELPWSVNIFNEHRPL